MIIIKFIHKFLFGLLTIVLTTQLYSSSLPNKKNENFKKILPIIIFMLTDDNKAPIITTPSTVTVNENQTIAIDVNATDPEGDTLTYSLSGGADESLFNINSSTGLVTFKSAPDYETQNSYNIIVSVSDGINITTQNITINIADINEAPIITTADSVTVNENQTNAIDVNATDPEGDTLTYSIRNLLDGNSFNINSSTGEITFKSAPDYETKNFYNLVVGVSDGINITYQLIGIDIADVVE